MSDKYSDRYFSPSPHKKSFCFPRLCIIAKVLVWP